MNESLVNNFNSKVTNKDKTYFLGDTVWGHNNYRDFFGRLNGQKYIVLGNHDNEQSYKKLLIDNTIQGIYKQKGITVENKYIWMSHYPHRSWNKSFHGSWHIYGHCHNTIPDYGLSCDVGVDKWNYFPVSFEELQDYFRDRDKNFNSYTRDDYKSYNKNFHKHFTGKYIERIEREEIILNNLI